MAPHPSPYKSIGGFKRVANAARYSMQGPPETAFTNPGFHPVNTKFFLRVGSSVWVEFGQTRVENVIGSKDARAVLAAMSPQNRMVTPLEVAHLVACLCHDEARSIHGQALALDGGQLMR